MRVLLAVALALVAGATGCSSDDVRAIEVDIRHSRFAPDAFEFEAGTTVRFVIRNLDPIDHEFIVGDAGVQQRHEKGAEAEHGLVPGEVSVPAGTTRATTYTFSDPGRLFVGCHLPRHFDYGMKGVVRVVR